jgi:hypothetical protein
MRKKAIRQLLLLPLFAAGSLALAQRGGEEMGRDPFVTARIVGVAGNIASAEKLRGDCKIIRNRGTARPLNAGSWLVDADILDMGTSCVLSLRVAGRADVKLTWRDGRYVRIEAR